MASPHVIRVFGDPVLKQQCAPIDGVDDALRTLADDMAVTMYQAPGVGLAGNQVGVQRRIFVYDDGAGDGLRVMINPVIHDTSGEWTFDEGCLSVPGMSFEIKRPKSVLIRGMDLDEKEVEFRADDYLGRIFQHETDHLNGMLLLDRLDPDRRKTAIRTLRERDMKIRH
jgi:peptide deformylase